MDDLPGGQFWADLIEIILIDMVMSADNAVGIALACRGLPPQRAQRAYLFGAIGAVLFRFLFATGVTFLLQVPYLRLLAAAGLLHIAVQMLKSSDADQHPELRPDQGLWFAVRTIMIADLAMSFDNAIAVGAVAESNVLLLALGMLFTAPMMIYGSKYVGLMLDRFPVLIPLGAAVLGYVAGKMAVTDFAIAGWIEDEAPAFTITGPILGAAYVLLMGALKLRPSVTAEDAPASPKPASPKSAAAEIDGAVLSAQYLAESAWSDAPVTPPAELAMAGETRP